MISLINFGSVNKRLLFSLVWMRFPALQLQCTEDLLLFNCMLLLLHYMRKYLCYEIRWGFLKQLEVSTFLALNYFFLKTFNFFKLTKLAQFQYPFYHILFCGACHYGSFLTPLCDLEVWRTKNKREVVEVLNLCGRTLILERRQEIALFRFVHFSLFRIDKQNEISVQHTCESTHHFFEQ